MVSRPSVLAAIVRLLELTLLRDGNSRICRPNGTFGMRTWRCRHAQIQGNHIHLSFRGKLGIYSERIRRSSDHRREPPQTAAAEIVTPFGNFEVQYLAHRVLRFLTMECGRNTTPTCSKGCARPAGRNEEDSSTHARLGGLQLNDSQPRVHREQHGGTATRSRC
jgi:DNA topoisomerase I-like protein